MENIDEMARRARNEYLRDWRAKNKDKVKATATRYWAKRAMAQKETEVKDNGKNANN